MLAIRCTPKSWLGTDTYSRDYLSLILCIGVRFFSDPDLFF